MTLVRLSRQMMRCITVSMASLLLVGCTPEPQAKRVLPQPPPARDNWAADAAKRVHDLERESNRLADDSRLLPGENRTQHSRLVQRVFGDLLKVFPLLANPSSDRVLAQRMSIIDNSRAQLAAASAGLAIEPAIDTALRAAAAAVADIAHSENYQQADVGATLDKLSAQVNRLDTERDTNLHRVDVAETVDLLSQVVNNLAAAIGGKLTGTAKPATQPARAPMAEPATPPVTPAVPAPPAPATPPAAAPDAK